MNTHEHYEELVAGYALGVLSPDERRAIETHLETCPECRVTLGELTRVSESIGRGIEPVTPPASLRARTLARATAAVRRDVPGSAFPAGPLPARPTRASWGPPLRLAASLVCIAGLVLYAMALRAQLASTRGMLTEALERVDELRRDAAEARRDSARLTNTVNVLQSADVIRVDLQGRGTAPAAAGRAYVSLARGLVFSAERLPGLAANRAYQLWVVPVGSGAVPVSAGVFSVDQSGNSLLSLDLPPGITTVAAVAVTEEPAGGSVTATTAPLLIGQAANN